jgi:hypothetical protein
MNCGRAAADLHTAYKDHQVDYSVNDSIYDAKEYNLRCNLTSPMKMAAGYDKVELILDSRLDQNAALQAVSCSVSKRMLKAYDESGNGSCQYQVAAQMGVREVNGEAIVFPRIDYESHPDELRYTDENAFMGPFVVSDVQFIVHQSDGVSYGYVPMDTPEWSTLPSWLAVGGTKTDWSGWTWISMWATRLYLARSGRDSAETTAVQYVLERRFINRDDALAFKQDGYVSVNRGVSHSFWKLEQSTHPISNQAHTFTAAVDACVIAVQMHNHTTASEIWYDTSSSMTLIWDMNSLAYDTAVVNNSQVATIQNMFMRNLFDGESTMKSRAPLDDAKEDIIDLAKTAA